MATIIEFYQLALPIDTVERGSDRVQPQTTLSALLDGAGGSADHVSTDPAEDRLNVTIRDGAVGAEVMATELAELAGSSTVDPIPIRDERTGTKRDGYYAADLATDGPAVRQVQEAYEVELRLRRRGSHEDSWRVARYSVEDVSSSNPYSATTEAPLGIPGQASKVRWAKLESGESQPVTGGDVTTTNSGAYADADVVDANSAPLSGDAPAVVYELGYDRDGRADCRVWDDRGLAKTDSNNTTQWAHVYETDHEFDGIPIVSNGLLRLTFDESNDVVAEEWDGSQWTFTNTTVANWTLLDADLGGVSPTHLGPGRVDLQTLWRGDDYDVRTLTYSGDATDVSVANGEVHGLAWGDDGSTLFLASDVNDAGGDYSVIDAAEAGIPYRAGTNRSSGNEFQTSDIVNARGIDARPNGEELFVTDNSDTQVHEIALSTAWDIQTASYPGRTGDLSAEIDDLQSGMWGNLGLNYYALNGGGGTALAAVHQYTAGAPFDVTTLSNTGAVINVSPQETSPRGLFLHPTGEQLYVVGEDADEVLAYSFGTDWELATAFYSGNSLSVGEAAGPNGIVWGDEATLTMLGRDAGQDFAFDYLRYDFSLGVSLQRGLDSALFSVPANESQAIPPGIESALDPIASDQTHDAQPSVGVVDRSALRR